ncbi:hypothetical protein HUS85_23760 [Pseudomonas protegens]|uniref:hypothetical protein n=1 Tax=Pseudomonas protegens TaxID=380021 RepID=UPI001B307D10|nr:hypothetical protein [Pseudomonas protegens]MBP5118865.1 hypothetical protein [Pseudomonas protegens]QTU16548.1 hypothetical protein HUT22_21500 [Pseudomonas protegens]
MARHEINLGTLPNGVGGDTPRVANTKINDMTEEVYGRIQAVESSLSGKVEKASVGMADGVASLDHDGKVPSSQLPNSPIGPSSTDDLPEGSTNQYFTQSRVRETTLYGLGALVNAAILATDTVLLALAKLQGQVNAKLGQSDVATDSDKLGGQPASYYTATMTGATDSADGLSGLVPAPPAGAAVRVLSSLGTWIAQATGSTWGSITGTLSSQADLSAALAAKQDTATAPMAKRYTSTAQQFVAGGQFVVSHRLGKEVAVVETWIRCKTAELGYSVGDKLPYPSMGTDSGGSTGLSVVCTSSTATVRMGTGSFIMLQKASGTTTFFTAANWEIYLEFMG